MTMAGSAWPCGWARVLPATPLGNASNGLWPAMAFPPRF
jgi:hypothetical protein